MSDHDKCPVTDSNNLSPFLVLDPGKIFEISPSEFGNSDLYGKDEVNDISLLALILSNRPLSKEET